MSRGFGAREVSFSPKASRLGVKAPAAEVEKAAKLLLASEPDRKNFTEFLESLAYHMTGGETDIPVAAFLRVGGMGGVRDLGKQTKLLVAEAFKRLPPEIRKLAEVDKKEILKLYRGVKDRDITEKNGWENGRFVYGFTPNKNVAKDFALGGRDGWDGIVGANDIESFGGIIDPDKAFDIVMKFAELAGPNTKVAQEMLKSNYTYSDYYSEEKEYIVYDIKFKKDGDEFYSKR